MSDEGWVHMSPDKSFFSCHHVQIHIKKNMEDNDALYDRFSQTG